MARTVQELELRPRTDRDVGVHFVSAPAGRLSARQPVRTAPVLRGVRPERTVDAASRWYSPSHDTTTLALAPTRELAEITYFIPPLREQSKPKRADRVGAIATVLVSALLAGILAAWALPYLKMPSARLSPAEGALIDEGRVVYQSTCIGCHGAALKGRLEAAPVGAPATAAAPRMATAAATLAPPLDGRGHGWLHSDGDLFRIVKYGMANCTGDDAPARMPPLGGEVSDGAIYAALAYIKSRWPPQLRQVQTILNDREGVVASGLEKPVCTPMCRPPSSANGASADTGVPGPAASVR